MKTRFEEGNDCAFKVVAKEKNSKKIVADYLFATLKEATIFHSNMVGRGYHSVMERLYFVDKDA